MSHFLSHWFVYENMFKIKPAVKCYEGSDVGHLTNVKAIFATFINLKTKLSELHWIRNFSFRPVFVYIFCKLAPINILRICYKQFICSVPMHVQYRRLSGLL